MSQTVDMKVNPLPARTWNHLKMNEAVLKGIHVEGEGNLSAQLPDGIQSSEKEIEALQGLATGMGPDMSKLLETIPVKNLTCPAGKKDMEPARLRFDYPAGGCAFNRIDLHAEEGGELTVVMDFASESGKDEVKSLAGLQTKVHVEKDAVVRLVQIQRLEGDFTFLNDIGGLCDEGGRLEVIQLLLKGQDTYQGCQANLVGRESALKMDVGYLVQKTEKLDMNYVAEHIGKESKSEIIASGVLRGNGFKILRETIDFKSGAAGAEGEEKDDALLLDDEVINQTIPLILCTEEDVQGSHGATIGKLSEDLLFYLESRGICKKEIYEMMAQARLHAVCNKIPDEKTREWVSEYLEGGQLNEY